MFYLQKEFAGREAPARRPTPLRVRALRALLIAVLLGTAIGGAALVSFLNQTDPRDTRVRWSKAISSEWYDGAASVRLDYETGEISASIDGPLPEGPLQIWVIDNLDGDDHTPLPEAGDRILLLGELGHDRADGVVSPAELDGLEVDLIAVTARGALPYESSLLLGGRDAAAGALVAEGDR